MPVAEWSPLHAVANRMDAAPAFRLRPYASTSVLERWAARQGLGCG